MNGVIMKKLYFILSLLLSLALSLAFTACGGENSARLSAPQIEIAENVLSWSPVQHADGYEIYENGALVSRQSETTYTVHENAKGEYKFKVKATSSDGTYGTSDFSNEVTYVVGSAVLSAPQITKQGKIISWTPVLHADGYEVYENGGLVTSQSATSYTIEKTEAGTYVYAVKATSTHPDYAASAFSNEVTEVITAQLAAPSIGISGKVISWEPVAHATMYAVYKNGYVEANVDAPATSYTITETQVGDYEFCVVARSTDPAFRMSEKSNVVKYTAEPVPLAAPSGLSVNGSLLSWNEVDGAGTYNIYEDDILVATQANSPYRISAVHDAGTFVYTIKALPRRGDKQYLESALSEPYTYVISDDRQPLSEPENLRIETRTVNLVPDDPSQGTMEIVYLVWNGVQHADGYFVYEDGYRIFATGGTEYALSEVMPGGHVYNVKAVGDGARYSSSGLSEPFTYNIAAEDTEFTVHLDISRAAGFNSAVTVSLWVQDDSGLPATDSGKTIVIPAGSLSGSATCTNSVKYVAKINGLPAGCYASEARLSAVSPEGTIAVYRQSSSLKLLTLGAEETLNAAEGAGGNVGAEQAYLFVAPEKGRYSLAADGGMICTVGGTERYEFSADMGEAVYITVNCQRAGSFTFKVEKAAKRYVNFGEMTADGPSGPANFIYDGQGETKLYFRASDRAVRYMFLFTTATMGNTRFVTLTVNGVDYEFDGGYCTSLNITIPASAEETELTIKLSGDAPGEGLTNVAFYVMPVSGN